MTRQQSQKVCFVGSNSQLYYDNLHKGAQPFHYFWPHYVYFYELRPPQIASTSLFDCLSTKHTHTVDIGLKHADRMWPAKAFCAAHDAFREYSHNQII